MALAMTTGTMVPAAQATSVAPDYGPNCVTYYRVYYRSSCHYSWRVYGVYTNAYQARQVAIWLSTCGYDVYLA